MTFDSLMAGRRKKSVSLTEKFLLSVAKVIFHLND
jgi:hypothetical protein